MGGCAGSWEECSRSGICRSKHGTGAIVVALQAGMELIATLCSGLFAGAAFYVNAVEHPARMSRGSDAAVAEWAPSYHRAMWMQAPLAVVGLAAAVGAWLAGSSGWWLFGGLTLGLAVPFTLVAIMPTNRRLESNLGLGPKET